MNLWLTRHASLPASKAGRTAAVLGARHDFPLRCSLHRIVYTALSAPRGEIAPGTQARNPHIQAGGAS